MSEQTERLRKVIESTGMSTLSFSKEIGLETPQRVYNVMKGKNKISKDLAIRISKKFDSVSAIWLLSGSQTLSDSVHINNSKNSDEVATLKEQIIEYKNREAHLNELVDFLKQQILILQENAKNLNR